MITFRALKFKPHKLSAIGVSSISSTKLIQAQYTFKNGFGVSVLLGSLFYSNGVDTYELGVTKNGTITHNTEVTSDVMGYLSRDEVSEIMVKLQQLPEDHYVERDD